MVGRITFAEIIRFPGYIYFLPSFVGRNHKNQLSIFTVNLLTGWKVIGWIGTLIWAYSSNWNDNNKLLNTDAVLSKLSDENYRESQEISRIYDKQ